jgi:superfamily I DNA/RNA helicase
MILRRAREAAESGTTRRYYSIVVDETQDMTAEALRFIRALAGDEHADDLFLVGDAHQRIYGHQARLGHCGIEIRGRSRRLRVNYRTTAEISRQSLSLLQGRSIDDLDGGRDDLDGYHSLRQGPAPEILHFSREADEAQAILDHIRSWLAFLPPAFICVAARTGDLLRSRYRPLLESAGIPTFTIEKDPESQASHDGVRLATMHRMKGLEFPAVLLAAVHDGVVPYPAPVHARTDDDLLATHELQERCLLYVAMTRARDRLCITGFGKRTPFLPRQAPGTGKTTGKASKT